MNKLLSILTLLIAFSLTAISPAYAGSHEKKADEAVATETKAEEAKEEKAEDSKEEKSEDKKDGDDAKKSDDDKKKKKKKGADGEEPECE